MHRPSLGPDGRYATRPLGPPDLGALQALFERVADYFVIATGSAPAPDEAERAYVAGPPTKAVHDKRVLGVFGPDGALVGVLDALTGWPDPSTWSIGLLVVDPAHRGRGLGTATLDAFEAWAATQGARRLRTAVVAHHGPGVRFLERHGYVAESPPERDGADRGRPTVVFLSKPAPGQVLP